MRKWVVFVAALFFVANTTFADDERDQRKELLKKIPENVVFYGTGKTADGNPVAIRWSVTQGWGAAEIVEVITKDWKLGSAGVGEDIDKIMSFDVIGGKDDISFIGEVKNGALMPLKSSPNSFSEEDRVELLKNALNLRKQILKAFLIDTTDKMRNNKHLKKYFIPPNSLEVQK